MQDKKKIDRDFVVRLEQEIKDNQKRNDGMMDSLKTSNRSLINKCAALKRDKSEYYRAVQIKSTKLGDERERCEALLISLRVFSLILESISR